MPLRVSNVVLCALVGLSASLLPSPAMAKTTTCALVEEPNVAYTVDPVDLTTYYGDIWRPDDGGANHPGIVTIHGGHFIQGSRTKLTGDAQTLACAGFVVLNIDYRLTGVELDAYTDALAAVAYLRSLVNYAGVGAHGVSAGAFLANRLAVEAKADAGSGFSGGGPNEAGLVTPYSKPVYMAHSIDDPNRPIADSEAIRDAYDALPAPGVPHRLDEIPGTAHGNEIWDH